MGYSIAKTLELTERANKLMPGCQSNLREPWFGTSLFIRRGEGSHVWDVDGNEYIDFLGAVGPAILGHGNKEYIQTLKDALDTGCFAGCTERTELEVELAEKFVKHVPCAEKVRFCLAGTEAVECAIRLARAYTKRPYVIRFEGHYHGWLDNILGGAVDDDAIGKRRPFGLESDEDEWGTEGRGPKAFEESFVLPWNDIEALEKVLEMYGREVAIVHMEAIFCNGGGCPPRSGYLERVRELCTKYGIVLSFDEIITGFRVGLSGAQGALGVTPDIATYGKAMGGGVLPISAVVGKREILDLLMGRGVVNGGTFNGYPLGLTASLAAIKILERDDGAVYRRMNRLQNRLTEGLKEIFRRRSIPVLIQGPTGTFYTLFVDKEVAYSVRDLNDIDNERQEKFYAGLREEGILLLVGCRWLVSGAHTDADVDSSLERAERALSRV